MDPVTHGLVGMMLGLMGGGKLALANGLMAASIAGSVFPDLDFVFQLRGDMAYLKQHRGFSHSLPSAALSSFFGAAVLNYFYPMTGFWWLFSAFFAGFLSHLLLDLLNSYGVKILWPLSEKKYTFNLLPLIDPLLVLICILGIIWPFQGVSGYPVLAVFAFYCFLRWVMRLGARRIVRSRLKEKGWNGPFRIYVLPSGRMSFLRWDFIVKSTLKDLVGSIDLGSGRWRVFRELDHPPEEVREIQEILSLTPLGQTFGEFTPLYHIKCEKLGDKFICHFMDLRYRVENRFMHNGVLVLNENREVEKAFFLPYSTEHRIYLA